MSKKLRENIRNVAVIAHVDHGKTTLVDSMLRQSGILGGSREDGDRVLDSNDLERERGITILAKNTSLMYGDVTINILDTPGHHDFGGEVERMLIMADGVLLLVDAAEGPLPQTRFVLKKALSLELPVIVAINKIDRKDARPAEVLDEVYDLFIDMGANDGDIDFPVLLTDGRAGIALTNPNDDATDLKALFDAIIAVVPPPEDCREAPFLLQVNNLDWDNFVGRIIIGKVLAGQVKKGQSVFVKRPGGTVTGKVMRLYSANELGRVEIVSAISGDIVSIAGIEEVTIGDTICAAEDQTPLPRIAVDEPTLAMHFCVNTGPFAGEDGQYITSRNLRDRLMREAMMNVAIRVEETDSTEIFRVVGRGELQMGILVETMRREGYELMLSRPEVVTRMENGKRMEPVERLRVDCDESYVGAVTQLLGERRAKMVDMQMMSGAAKLIYSIPTRGLIGLHSRMLTETRGSAVLNTSFDGWIPWEGTMPNRVVGALVSDRTGTTTPYALFNLQPRGTLFVHPGTRVYEGMVIGETPNGRDLNVNATKEKKLTNIRAAGKDDAVLLSPPRQMSLEEIIEFIADDELVEVTPKNMRIRKKLLAANTRHRAAATSKS